MEPATGRFLTPDPLGAWADPYSYGNAYTYAGNNPASMSDSMGLAAEHNGGAPDIGDAEDDYLRSLTVAGAGGSVQSPSKIVVDFSMHRVRSDLSMSALERFGWHWRCWGSDATHTVLDAAGAVDGWGTPFDVLNIAVCLAEGDRQGALECAMGLLPGLSAQVAVARLSRRARAVARGLDDLEDADDYLGKLKRAVDKAGGLCGAGCFVRGTLVDTRDGPRPIEEIRAGDMVTARDQMTGEVEERQVVQTFEHADSAVVEVTYVDAQGKVETLGATPDHPFHVDGVGWVDAGKLQPGQRVTGLDGDYLVVQHVALDDERHTTYNFEVGEFHTYFVGNGDAWVHNAGGRGRLSPQHHIYPQREDLAEEFRKRGIDPDDYAMRIPFPDHVRIHKGGPRGGEWNKAWQDYFDNNPDSVAEDVHKEGKRLLRKFKVPRGKIGRYCRK